MKTIKNRISILIMSFLLLISGSSFHIVEAAKPIRLIVDGNDITALSEPVIENDRTLVPIRFVSEELGAEVIWNDTERTVYVKKDNQSVKLRIGSQLIEYNDGADYDISDVAPKIINDRTFVPLRLVGNALGIGIEWNNEEREVIVSSDIASEKASFFEVKIISHNVGQDITGKTSLQIGTSDLYTKDGNEVRFLLLDPSTSKGFIIGRGTNVVGSYDYTPKIEESGRKVLVGAVYNSSGKLIAGHAIPVNINVSPQINLVGLTDGQAVTGTTSISIDVSFVPKYIKYEFTNMSTGKVVLTDLQDPMGTYSWNPMISENGSYSVKAIAYDMNDTAYASMPLNVQVQVERSLSLGGVTEGSTINNSVGLTARRNFDVSETQFLIRDVNTGAMSTIGTIPYGTYKWFPGPSDSGQKELIVRVLAAGVYYDSEPVRVNIDGSARLLMEGVGPKQVITAPVKIKVNTNVAMENMSLIVKNVKTGSRKTIASDISVGTEYTYTPASADEGNVIIQAEGTYQGRKISSEEINARVYLGEIFGPKPVIEKENFLGMASRLARTSYEDTGMSAALQTAQAILETGWGQSVPVDKYTGTLSNNLFGIKGSGPKGSVTSNTWEVYNGVTYRVDADFRAYDSVDQSWADHKEFLKRDRYAGFREVMFDYHQGAWALKRAGYATDPEYPIKLMNLIKQYNLLELDKVGI